MAKKIALVLALLMVATAAWAGPKDKLKSALVNPDKCLGNANWNNKTVKASLKADATAMKIGWKDTPGLNGKTIYCFMKASASIGQIDGGLFWYTQTVVLKGVVDGGKMKMKAKIASVTPGGVKYSTEIATKESEVWCEIDDSGTWDPADACDAGGSGSGLWLAPDLVNFKEDSLAGVCQGGIAPSDPFGSYPDGDVIAVEGMGTFQGGDKCI
jgi:hypothetical protein